MFNTMKVLKKQPIPFDVECQITFRSITEIVGISVKKTFQGSFRKLQNSQIIIFETLDKKLFKVELPRGHGTYANEILEIIILATGKLWSFYEEI